MYIDKIETKDLILKKASMNDIDDMYSNIWTEEESAKYMLWIPIKNTTLFPNFTQFVV